jgi:hypothetical protein
LTCGGTGVARGAGSLTEPDEEIEGLIEDENMQTIYADSDREVTEAWRKK